MDRTTRAVIEVARGVLEELDLDLLLDRVLDAAQELTEARYAALGVLNEPQTELARFLTRGIDEEARARIGSLPSGRGVLGTLISDPAPLRVADVGAHPRSYGLPHGHPPMRSFLGVPIVVEERSFGNLYLTEKEGGAEFSEADEQSVALLAEFAGVAIGNARRYTDTSQRRDELERTVAALEATTQIARAVGGETDLEVILDLVAKRGRALVSARALLIELKQRDELVIAAGAGELPAELIGRSVEMRDTVASHAMRTRCTQRLEDDLNRARFDEHGLGQLNVSARGGLAVPLIFRGQAHGVLLALDRIHDGPAFSEDDQRLLESFAVSVASAVATAQSVASERQSQRLAAAEGERQRWARELHDETLQSLSALRIGLSAARRADQAEPLRRAVGLAVEQVEDAIANLRSLITDLRPAALDELGVQAAIESLSARSSRHGIAVDVSVDLAYEQGREPSRPVPELETALYRIVQEALTNASKHGQAKRAVVEIHEDATSIHLSIRDDGDGFDPRTDTDGFGLLGMHERVELLGGELSIDSTPGRGAVVRASFPAKRRPQAGVSGERAQAS